MKDTYYFQHDYNARQDPKLMEVLMELGCEGIGIYWCVIEQMYEQGGTLPLDSIKLIAYSLHVEREVVQRLVDEFGLFEQDGVEFWSNAVRARIKKRAAVSEKRRAAGMAGMASRWDKVTNANTSNSKPITNATQTDNKGIAKNNKENKRKEKEIKENNNSLSLSLSRSKEETEAVADATAEKEKILEVFYFEKNCVDYIGEARRFYSHYEANGWCRNGSTVPVKDRLALARGWKPESPNNRADPTALRWLRRIYDRIKEQAPECAIGIIRGIKSLKLCSSNALGECAEVLVLTNDRKAAHNISVALNKWPDLCVPGWKVKFQIFEPKNNAQQ